MATIPVLYKGTNEAELIAIDTDEENEIYSLRLNFANEHYLNAFMSALNGHSLDLVKNEYVVKYNKGTYEVLISNLKVNDNNLIGRISFIHGNILIQVFRTINSFRVLFHNV